MLISSDDSALNCLKKKIPRQIRDTIRKTIEIIRLLLPWPGALSLNFAKKI